MAEVKIDAVGKHYGTVEVLKSVSVDVRDGEFLVLVGPSGCGKSTLLRMIAGLEDISSGEMWIGDRMVTDLPAKERDIAMVFQSYALYPHMTVANNMSFALKLKGASKQEIAAKVADSARILGLENLLDRYPRQLSGGQRQRVAMGRAIVRNPQVFLFDEPLSNLDAKLRVVMRSEIKELHQRLGTTTVYVTHDQVEAMTLADRIVVMRDGRIEQIGTPLELYDQPANRFVAGFIGSPAMNFLEGASADGGFVLNQGPVLETLRPPAGATTCGIRPEHFERTADGLDCEVAVVEPTGSETLVIARTRGQQITAVFKDRLDVRPGDRIGLRPDPAKLHFFDAEGRRMD
ncbi:MAG: sn-glycerol-3-phosphate ABC transporter ATP-binding protein UgpC [Devosia sp.]|uniref:ABC transporter ATP-binding protein n=1 Tax=Devosia sp. TaxID=1871048 RepID=UPI0024CD02BE|nr:sn-glycerol-3-phosphate ABC transporter ATP-binding protein UgpC [Devosia sp.]UYN98951.1 MAG: sn-glycerol-3-phosphate ABC transporter ATP-binding protein UgpC [Devosia sp.]